LSLSRLHWLVRRPPPSIQLRLGWIGFRGAALLIFGIIYVFMGVAITFNPAPDPTLFHTQIPLPIRILIWAGAGAVAIVAAFLPRLEVIGFALLFIGPAERFLSFGWAMIAGPNLMRLTGVCVYLLHTALVVLIAAWPEPVPPRPSSEPSPGTEPSP
jgi:hypothetical protein